MLRNRNDSLITSDTRDQQQPTWITALKNTPLLCKLHYQGSVLVWNGSKRGVLPFDSLLDHLAELDNFCGTEVDVG